MTSKFACPFDNYLLESSLICVEITPSADQLRFRLDPAASEHFLRFENFPSEFARGAGMSCVVGVDHPHRLDDFPNELKAKQSDVASVVRGKPVSWVITGRPAAR